MLRFIFASLAAALGLFYMNTALPGLNSLMARLENAQYIYVLLQGLILVVVYKLVASQLSGPGWTRGTMFGLILFGLSSFLYASQAGVLDPGTLSAAGADARGAAISLKEIFAWQGAIAWVVTGAVVGSIMQDKPEANAAA